VILTPALLVDPFHTIDPPLAFHRPRRSSQPRAPSTTTEHLQLSHLVEGNTFGRMSLGGPRCTAILDNVPLRLFTDRSLLLSTPTLTALGPLAHIEALWKDSKALQAERPEISPEVPETPPAAREEMRHEEDGHIGDGSIPSHASEAGRPRLTELRRGGLP
jgi:hypothetical protein